MYDHSGIVLSLSNNHYPFNDRWDAGQLGLILVDREKALKEFGKKRLTEQLKQKIRQIIEGEIETYNQHRMDSCSSIPYEDVVHTNSTIFRRQFGFHFRADHPDGRSLWSFAFHQTTKSLSPDKSHP